MFQKYLRGLIVKLTTVQGVTTGSAVVTDAAGTLQQYLRGLVKLFAARIPALGQGAAAASVPVVLASDYLPGSINAKGNVPVQITISDGTSTQSAALPVGNYIATSNIDVALRVAANPTAVTTDDPAWAYTYRRLVIATASDKVAAIRLTATTGVVTLTLEG